MTTTIFFGFVNKICWICFKKNLDLSTNFLDLLTIFFGFLGNFFGFVENIFWICRRDFLDLLMKFFVFVGNFFGFVDKIFCICGQNLLSLSEKYANDTIQWPHRYMGHTAWAPEGREGRSQRGPKGRKLEVGARRAPKLLVCIYLYWINTICRIQIIQGPDLPGPNLPGPDLPPTNFPGPNLLPRGPICRGPICQKMANWAPKSAGPNLPPNRRGAQFALNPLVARAY